ncbi:MAG: hypothetical protein HWD82_03430 [Flavobacteriaceae bacterium]|nr:hypothetical protein [Flavobacteriaceae bacterium]
MKKTIFVFSLLILAIILFFHLSKYALTSNNLKIEIIIAIIALVFFFIGVFLHINSLQKQVVLPTKKIDYNKIKDLEISGIRVYVGGIDGESYFYLKAL